MQYIETFKVKSCSRITINYYKNNTDARKGKKPKSCETYDKDVITEILSLLNTMPDKGDIMVSWGKVPVLEVLLHDKNAYFSYYNRKIKTPSTSFYSNDPAEEKELYSLLLNQLGK